MRAHGRAPEISTTLRPLAVPGAVVAATVALLSWSLGRPGLWLDESASVVASARTWPNLWLMLQGTDAPLVPYYAVLKVCRAVAGWLFPFLGEPLAQHPELAVRWPSAVATVAAVGLLAGWVQRVSSRLVAVSACTVLLLTVGVSRYGQEGRPYAPVMCLAVVSSVAWWSAVVRGRRALLPVYVLSGAALVAGHALAATLLVAHVVAAALLPREAVSRSRGARAVRTATTLAAGAAALGLSAPFTVAAVQHGGGANPIVAPDLERMVNTWLALFGTQPDRLLFVVLLLVLAALGLSAWNVAGTGALVRLAVCWAVLPTLALALAVDARPNLLVTRYLLFTLPAWAVLAGVGLERVSSVVAGAPGFLFEARLRVRALAALVAALALGALTLVQAPTLAAVRTSGGHGEDLRPSLAAAESPAYRGLPIVVRPPTRAILIQAYSSAAVARVVNAEPQSGLPNVWPTAVPRELTTAELQDVDRVVLLVRRRTGMQATPYVSGFRIAAELPAGTGWSAYLMARPARS